MPTVGDVGIQNELDNLYDWSQFDLYILSYLSPVMKKLK